MDYHVFSTNESASTDNQTRNWNKNIPSAQESKQQVVLKKKTLAISINQRNQDDYFIEK